MNRTIRRKSGILFEKMPNETILIDTDRGIFYSLNETASCIWKFLWKKRTPDEIADHIQKNFCIDQASIAKHLNSFLLKYKDLFIY